MTSATLRPLTTVIPASERGVRWSRRIVAGSLAAAGPTAQGTAIRTVDVDAASGLRVRGEWVRGRGVVWDDAVILYVHGSGYALCSARTHRGLTSRLSAMTGLPVFACDYRLAPRHRFPDAADDVRAAYDWLVGVRGAPDKIVIAGDSAGGHLAVDLALEIVRAGAPPPAALLLFSPLMDPTLALAERRELSRRDPMISAARARRLVGLYTRGVDPKHPRLSLSVTGTHGFPPTLIQAGGAEMLAADAEQLARDITAAGGSCALEIWPDQMHVFQALPLLVPEARVALRRAARFVRSQVEQAQGMEETS